jgi:NAD(P)-dependent dehydrogenase (short-subunit alcohol dehydrogenase family)
MDARALAGRHALITGASRGIGLAIAEELARLGADLSLVARRRETLDPLAERLGRAHGVRARAIAADMTDETAARAAMTEAGPVAILVNNVGGAESAPYARTDAAMLRRMLELNLVSAHVATLMALPAMRQAGWGRVINVASTAGLKAYAYVSAYVAAKHALVGLTRALALECARDGVTVNAVCPGYTDTPMLAASIEATAARTARAPAALRESLSKVNPQGRLIEPAEIAAAVGFLALPASAAINGHALTLSGGET